MIETRDKKLSQIISRSLQELCKGTTYLHLSKMHFGCSLCYFQNFSKFLENFGAGSGSRAFRLCAIIATYAFIFKFLKKHWEQILES